MSSERELLEELLTKYDVPHPEGGSWLPLGWGAIVDNLIEDLIALGWDKGLLQVKEKFGGLRFYITQSDTELHERIRKAMDASRQTCTTCGEPGIPRSIQSTWIETTCQRHSHALPD